MDELLPGSITAVMIPVKKLKKTMINTEMWVSGMVTIYLVILIKLSTADMDFPTGCILSSF